MLAAPSARARDAEDALAQGRALAVRAEAVEVRVPPAPQEAALPPRERTSLHVVPVEPAEAGVGVVQDPEPLVAFRPALERPEEDPLVRVPAFAAAHAIVGDRGRPLGE